MTKTAVERATPLEPKVFRNHDLFGYVVAAGGAVFLGLKLEQFYEPNAICLLVMLTFLEGFLIHKSVVIYLSGEMPEHIKTSFVVFAGSITLAMPGFHDTPFSYFVFWFNGVQLVALVASILWCG